MHNTIKMGVVLSAVCGGSVMYAGQSLADDIGVQIPEVTVIGVTPLLGTGVPLDQIPANVQVISPAQQRNDHPQSVSDMLDRRLGSVTSTDYQGNPMQANLSFRGFTASPVLGEAQGISVYQNGMRLNEAFGDLVNWDMNPSFAVDSIQVMPGSNPVFGLNALGGAVALKMKDGFTTHGTTIELDGGSTGAARMMGEIGRQFGDLGVYSGIATQYDHGWRDHSSSRLVQSYTDIAIRRGALDLGMGTTLAASDLSGLGGAPIELAHEDRSAVFTSPDQTQNMVAAVDLRGAYAFSGGTAMQGNVYYRRLNSRTHNGDTFDGQACAAPDDDELCNDDGEELKDRSGRSVPSALVGNAAINNTSTTSDSVGAALQLSHDGRVAGLANLATLGTSLDQGWTRYHTNTELGRLADDRSVIGSGLYLGDDDYNVRLNTKNTYYGLYYTDTLSLTQALHLTLAGRYNWARVKLDDKLGDDLNGDHTYGRFNPSAGLSWQVAPGLTTFASYAEANRVPTAAELSCADPTRPCRVPNAFQADPPLDQVVSRTVEVGARGNVGLAGGKLGWSLAAFTTRNQDDIIFVSAGPVVGSGYFANVGSTTRQGLEGGVDTRLGRWTLFANYALTRAIFSSDMTLHSPQNSAADADGNIQVNKGDRMPGIPQHSLKLGADYAITDAWMVGADARLSSNRVLRGDESNTMDKIPGFGIVNVKTSYKFTDHAEGFLKVNNVFDKKYYTAGVLGEPDTVFPSYTDPRFLSAGAPLNLWAGLRISF